MLPTILLALRPRSNSDPGSHRLGSLSWVARGIDYQVVVSPGVSNFFPFRSLLICSLFLFSN